MFFMGGIEMKMENDMKLKIATSGLTGRRACDIPYLKAQIRENAEDPVLASLLTGILSALCFPEAGEAAA